MNEQATAGWTGTAPQQWPGYGPYPYRVQRTSPQAVVVLVLGLASLTVFWGVAGIVALVLSRGAKREVEASNGALGGAGMIRAGVICSWISIAITVLVVLAVGLLFSSLVIGGDTYTSNNPLMFAPVVP